MKLIEKNLEKCISSY